MKRIGLTGGIGMGKSACAVLLRQQGICVVDTDDLAREVVEPGQPALAEIQAVFGPEVLDLEGRLRRAEVGSRVFAEPHLRERLEAILHPRIRALWRNQMERWRHEGHSLAFVVIPLLFETGAEQELDATLCVACASATQQHRLLARGWSQAEIERRNEAQLPVAVKIARADYVIWSEGSLAVHAEQLERVLLHLKARS